MVDFKTCSKCHEPKPVSEFGRHSQTKDGLKSRCKICNAAEARAFEAANKELVAARKAARYQANKEKVKARTKSYYLANTEKALEARARYHAAHPEVARQSRRKRRAKMNSANGTISADIENRLMLLQKHKCVNCRTDLRKTGHHLDHMMPLALGGEHEDSNMQLLCPTCNLSKHAKHPVDWAQRNGRLL